MEQAFLAGQKMDPDWEKGSNTTLLVNAATSGGFQGFRLLYPVSLGTPQQSSQATFQVRAGQGTSVPGESAPYRAGLGPWVDHREHRVLALLLALVTLAK